ncbi:hypothetical protein D3C81_1350690 [compost metagenome]
MGAFQQKGKQAFDQQDCCADVATDDGLQFVVRTVEKVIGWIESRLFPDAEVVDQRIQPIVDDRMLDGVRGFGRVHQIGFHPAYWMLCLAHQTFGTRAGHTNQCVSRVTQTFDKSSAQAFTGTHHQNVHRSSP